MKKFLLVTFALGCFLTAQAEDVRIASAKVSGPYVMQKPFMVDKVDVQQKEFSTKSFLDTPIDVTGVFTHGTALSAGTDGFALPAQENALYVLGFTLQNTRFADATISLDGLKDYVLFMDGKKVQAGDMKLEPGTHRFAVKYLSDGSQPSKLNVKVSTKENDAVKVVEDDHERLITLQDITDGRRLNNASLSPDGKYLIASYNTVLPGGESRFSQRVTEMATGKVLTERSERIQWMPRSNKYYFIRKAAEGRQLVTVDPLTGSESIICHHVPMGGVEIAPTEDYLIVTMTQEGPKERKDVYEIVQPEDRQPGWRDRSYPAKFDLATGVLQPLTFGYHNAYVSDISKDGKYVLLQTSESRLTARPTSLTSIYRMNVNTLETELLVEKDGFIHSGQFSPDGTQVLITGTPESFGGIGKNVRPDQTPSMSDVQLYLLNIADKKVTPLTKYFNPNVNRVVWNKFDNQIYFTAENRDCISLFRLNPKDWKFTQMDVKEELIKSFSLAENAPVMVYSGQGAMNSDRLYAVDMKKMKTSLLEDYSKVLLDGVKLGTCEAWDFVNSRGDTICGRFYLPPYFDKNKKYPLIVNYYGGCSPTSRNFESRYPHHLYAAMGYVVYIINPSGATGFGQEFSARHVNTAGEGVAQDIIEGTKEFCRQHSFVNDKKIGCIGASYGGFMTQYLQTKTDIFAAAISHAGISDHTSYWGEGYWGYSYSEVSMANSYPWTRKDLFVDRSPLFNADKIHTPLLFLHGSVDTNVPVGESIQMFTALKLLGRPTAFVVVDDQNHHILEYDKRIRWQNTIFAWFQKYLQDDASWWEQLYPTKQL